MALPAGDTCTARLSSCPFISPSWESLLLLTLRLPARQFADTSTVKSDSAQASGEHDGAWRGAGAAVVAAGTDGRPAPAPSGGSWLAADHAGVPGGAAGSRSAPGALCGWGSVVRRQGWREPLGALVGTLRADSGS